MHVDFEWESTNNKSTPPQTKYCCQDACVNGGEADDAGVASALTEVLICGKSGKIRFFLREMLGTLYGSVGTRFL